MAKNTKHKNMRSFDSNTKSVGGGGQQNFDLRLRNNSQVGVPPVFWHPKDLRVAQVCLACAGVFYPWQLFWLDKSILAYQASFFWQPKFLHMFANSFLTSEEF